MYNDKINLAEQFEKFKVYFAEKAKEGKLNKEIGLNSGSFDQDYQLSGKDLQPEVISEDLFINQ